MARLPRALVIACENYPKAEDVAQRLAGTLDAARRFYEWLTKTKGVGVTEIYLCCDDALMDSHPQDRTYAGGRDDVTSAITDLVEQGRDKTSELYVFFSGHGVGWELSPQQRGLDVLLASDYRSRKRSGGCCIKLDELRDELRKWLGGEDHYYFLDACRTVLKVGEIRPTELGLTLDLATTGEPTTYVLYSTKFGEAAPVNSGFSQALVDGLTGKGRAKQRVQGDWWVRFDRLQKFVQERLKVKTDLAREGARDGLILKLKQVAPTSCTVNVEDAQPTDAFALTIEVSGIQQTFPFTGDAFQRDLQPNDDGYRFDLKANGTPLPLVAPPLDKPLDLYDPVALRFRKILPEAAVETRGPQVGVATERGAGVALREIAHPNIEIRVRKFNTGETVSSAAPKGWIELPPGTHTAEILENGVPVRRKQFELKPGERLDLDPLGPPTSRVQRAIEARLPRRWDLPDASETLGGPIVQQNTALWLTLLGASRLIRPPSEFSKLGPFPLATFDDLRKGDCVLYALAGLENRRSPKLAVSKSNEVSWQPMEKVKDFDGVHHLRLNLQPGPQLVSFALEDMPPLTYATYAFPNRAVLMVFDEERSGRLDTRQMLLPVYSLTEHLDWVVKERLNMESLRLIKYLILAQERFAQRESLEPATLEEKQRWDEMLYGKWLDPVFALMAIFESARRSGAGEAGEGMKEAIKNLEKYFGDLPDVAAARRLFGQQPNIPKGAPLLRESLQRMPELKKALPLSADFLDYSSIWTAWFGAVNAPGN